MKTPVTQDNTKEEMLSPHFSLREMTRSGTALRYGIDNTPTKEAIERLRCCVRTCLNPFVVGLAASLSPAATVRPNSTSE